MAHPRHGFGQSTDRIGDPARQAHGGKQAEQSGEQGPQQNVANARPDPRPQVDRVGDEHQGPDFDTAIDNGDRQFHRTAAQQFQPVDRTAVRLAAGKPDAGAEFGDHPSPAILDPGIGQAGDPPDCLQDAQNTAAILLRGGRGGHGGEDAGRCAQFGRQKLGVAIRFPPDRRDCNSQDRHKYRNKDDNGKSAPYG